MRTRVERVAVGGMAMSRRISPRQKEAAWRWMKFFTSKAGGQKLLGKEKNCVTAVEEYAWSPKYFMQAPPQHCRPYVTSLKAAVLFMPPIVGASEYSAAISNPMMDDMLRDPKANIPAMLKAYQDAANALLKHEPTTSSPLVR
jgi:ABC-type glycerol-3-phosphate transport system substrate-binding protein